MGKHLTVCAAFAIAIGQTLGVSQNQIRHALSTAKNEAMRQEVVRRNGITILMDCYNASPESVYAVCDTLISMARENNGRTLALLGDMLELGEETRRLHEEVGAYYAQKGIDMLFTFGAAAENIAVGARRAGMPDSRIFSNPNPAEPMVSAAQINSVYRVGDVLLLKASRTIAAERILAFLQQNPINAGEVPT